MDTSVGDIICEIAQHLDYPDMLRWCQASRRVFAILERYIIWKHFDANNETKCWDIYSKYAWIKLQIVNLSEIILYASDKLLNFLDTNPRNLVANPADVRKIIDIGNIRKYEICMRNALFHHSSILIYLSIVKPLWFDIESQYKSARILDTNAVIKLCIEYESIEAVEYYIQLCNNRRTTHEEFLAGICRSEKLAGYIISTYSNNILENAIYRALSDNACIPTLMKFVEYPIVCGIIHNKLVTNWLKKISAGNANLVRSTMSTL